MVFRGYHTTLSSVRTAASLDCPLSWRLPALLPVLFATLRFTFHCETGREDRCTRGGGIGYDSNHISGGRGTWVWESKTGCSNTASSRWTVSYEPPSGVVLPTWVVSVSSDWCFCGMLRLLHHHRSFVLLNRVYFTIMFCWSINQYIWADLNTSTDRVCERKLYCQPRRIYEHYTRDTSENILFFLRHKGRRIWHYLLTY